MKLFHVLAEPERKHLHLKSGIDPFLDGDRIDECFPKLPPKFLVFGVFGCKSIKINITRRHQGTAFMDFMNEHAVADGVYNEPVLPGKAV